MTLESIINFFSADVANAISWTIVHSLWQASFIALVMSIFLRRGENRSSSYRYNVALVALYGVFFCSVATFLFYYFSNKPGVIEQVVAYNLEARPATGGVFTGGYGWLAAIPSFLNTHYTFIANTWMIGALFFAFRFMGGFAFVNQFNKINTPIRDSRVQSIFQSLLTRFGIKRSVQLIETEKVSIPMVVGFFKPIILLPAGIVNQLELKEIEYILSHELAHVMRNDFFINFIQSAVEIFFYYHPAVWWISANIRSERENSCDDLAVNICGNAMDYAKTLVKVQEWQMNQVPDLAIPLSRDRQSLAERINRILNQPQNRSQIREKMAATILLIAGLFAFTNISTQNVQSIEPLPLSFNLTVSSNDDLEIEESQTFQVLHGEATRDSLPKSRKRENIIIQKSDDERSVEIEIKDGEVTKLKIDGEEIPEEDYEKYEEEYEDYLNSGKGNLFFFGDEGHGFKRFDLDDRDMIFEVPYPGDLDSLHSHLYKFFPKGDSSMLWFGEENWEEYMEKYKDQMEEYGDGARLFFKEMPGFDYQFNIDTLNFDFGENFFFNLDSMNNHFEMFELDSLRGFLSPRMLEDHGEEMKKYLEEYLDGGQLPRIYEFRDQDLFPRHFEFKEGEPFEYRHRFGSRVNDRLIDELWEDGLLIEGKDNKVELSGKHLKINGKKQPSNIWNKYKKIYEDSSGLELTKNSKIELNLGSERPVKRRKVIRI